MARVTSRITRRLLIDKRGLAKVAAEAIERHIRARVAERRDVDDRPLAGYSQLYRRQLEAIGESAEADMQRSGGLLSSIRLARTDVRGSRISMVFAADDARSPERPRPPWWVFAASKTASQQARSLALWRASPKRVRRSPPHSQLLAWLQRGARHSRIRRILGVSPRGAREVRAAIERARAFRST